MSSQIHGVSGEGGKGEVGGDPANTAVDLRNCEREPIHIPGKIQPHGVLLVVDEKSLDILHASANTDRLLGKSPDLLLKSNLSDLWDTARVATLRQLLREARVGTETLYLFNIDRPGQDGELYVLAHRWNGLLLLEFEIAGNGNGSGGAGSGDLSFQSLHARVRASLARLEAAQSVKDLCQIAAEEIQAITGFGRVLVYQFDADWHGKVLAEVNDGSLESYLHHYFPASDIPKQARELYRLNRIRLIADVHYNPADVLPTLTPKTGKPLDLSYAGLRSVSPIHIEYLKNMDTGASMSISIIREGRLWGLIACHDRKPRFLSFDIRAACDHLAQILALQLSAKEYSEDSEYRLQLTALQNRLIGYMASQENFVEGLTHHQDELLALANATGAAIFLDGELQLVGQTPDRADVFQIIDYLTQAPLKDTLATDHLVSILPSAASYKEVAAGLLAITIPRFPVGHVLWFRPEVIQTITWAGNPQKPVTQTAAGDLRLHPRKSFDAWKQVVELRSLPWKRVEIQAAAGLRDGIVGIVLKKAEELARLNADLQRSNKELEAFSYSVSHDLRAPFRHIVGYANLLKKREATKLDDTSKRYLDTIAESARHAGSLVDGLLAFSQMGRKSLTFVPVEMSRILSDVQSEVVTSEGVGREIEWSADRLPQVFGDPVMLKLAMRNLLSNAVKYTRVRPKAQIRVGVRREGDEYIFSIADNGAGFDMAYADKLFGVFQRLHRADEFEGTGIGLANVRRIIERHGGRTWAEAQLDHGATFFFTLPANPPPSP